MPWHVNTAVVGMHCVVSECILLPAELVNVAALCFSRGVSFSPLCFSKVTAMHFNILACLQAGLFKCDPI